MRKSFYLLDSCYAKLQNDKSPMGKVWLRFTLLRFDEQITTDWLCASYIPILIWKEKRISLLQGKTPAFITIFI